MRVALRVKGMGCEGCVETVTKALKGVAGVTSADVSLDQATAVVELTLGTATTPQLVAAIEAEGYQAEEKRL